MSCDTLPRNAWKSLCDGLAESVLEMSEDSVLEMVREEGQEPLVAAARVRSVLQAADRECRQRELALAAERHRRTVARLQRRQYRLPQGHDAQRAWLLSLLRHNPGLGKGLTLQHREFSEISDSEVEGYLKQLVELGVAENVSDEPTGEN